MACTCQYRNIDSDVATKAITILQKLYPKIAKYSNALYQLGPFR